MIRIGSLGGISYYILRNPKRLVFRVSKGIGMVYILIRFCLAASTPNKTCVRWFDIICSKNETSSEHLVSEFRVSAYLRLGH